MAELAAASVLVIDANPGMRAQLRAMLASFGVSQVQFATNAGSAIKRLKERRFDIVLCEYNLDDGQDGQHLLEDLRSHDIIPLDTLFVMVTGERNYERVVSTAELTPDDYILKPLAAHALHYRLQKVLDRREVFLPAYRLMAMGNPMGAAEVLHEAEASHPQYRSELLRKQAELLIDMGRLDDAETAYRAAQTLGSLPWAQFGLARTLMLKKHYEAAEDILCALVAEHELYIGAYDLLAQCRELRGHSGAALETLNDAVRRSPHRLHRLRNSATLALQLGQPDAAAEALGALIEKSRYSEFRDPEDHVRLVQAQLGQGKPEAARETIRDMERSLGARRKTQICAALCRNLYYTAAAQPEEARSALVDAIATGADTTELSPALKQDLFKACFDNDLESEGCELVLDVLRNAADDGTVESTRAALHSRGLETLAEELETRTREEVRKLIVTGAEKAKSGDFDGAVVEMMNAARRMPGNPHVLFNAALALLRHIEHRGWNERFATQAGALITRARRADPASPRLAAISEFMHALFKKHDKLRQRGTGSMRAAAGLKDFFSA